jgi:hypothetical protein
VIVMLWRSARFSATWQILLPIMSVVLRAFIIAAHLAGVNAEDPQRVHPKMGVSYIEGEKRRTGAQKREER